MGTAARSKSAQKSKQRSSLKARCPRNVDKDVPGDGDGGDSQNPRTQGRLSTGHRRLDPEQLQQGGRRHVQCAPQDGAQQGYREGRAQGRQHDAALPHRRAAQGDQAKEEEGGLQEKEDAQEEKEDGFQKEEGLEEEGLQEEGLQEEERLQKEEAGVEKEEEARFEKEEAGFEKEV